MWKSYSRCHCLGGVQGFFCFFLFFVFFEERLFFRNAVVEKHCLNIVLEVMDHVISQYWFHQCYILSPVSLLKGSDVGSLLSGTIGIWTDNGLDYCLNDFDLLAMDT